MRSQQEGDRPQAAGGQDALLSSQTPVHRQESVTSDRSFTFGQDGGMSASYSPNRQGGTSTPLPGFWIRADPQNNAVQEQIDKLQGSGQSTGHPQEQSRPSAPTPSRLYIQGSLRSQYALPGQIERSGMHFLSVSGCGSASAAGASTILFCRGFLCWPQLQSVRSTDILNHVTLLQATMLHLNAYHTEMARNSYHRLPFTRWCSVESKITYMLACRDMSRCRHVSLAA